MKIGTGKPAVEWKTNIPATLSGVRERGEDMKDHVGGRLLIVNDDPDVLQGLFEILEGEEFQIRTCPDAFSALEFVEYDKVDVVLSDIKMPAVSGLELLEHVHRIDPDIPVIMMTGNPDVETAIAAVDITPSKLFRSRSTLKCCFPCWQERLITNGFERSSASIRVC